MNDPETKANPPQPETLPGRPFFLTLICLSAFVFFGILTLIFLGGLVFSQRINHIAGQYLPDESLGGFSAGAWFTAFLLIHLLALTGSILIWYLRKSGYYIVTGACLAISAVQLFNPGFSWAATYVYIFFIFGFGFFYRRLRG